MNASGAGAFMVGRRRPIMARSFFRRLSMQKEVTVLMGSGAIGVAIARRVSVGRELILADLKQENAERQAAELRSAGYRVHALACDVANREQLRAAAARARELGPVKALIHTAGLSPSQAPAAQIFRVDLYGTALLLEEFAPAMAPGGAAVVIGSQSAHRLEALTVEQNRELATLPPAALLELPYIKNERDSLRAYQLAKRGNALRVAAEAVRWGQRRVRVNCISAGIVHTPLANDELNGERKDFYRAMLAALPVGRGGTPDEIANLAELLLGERGGYISGSDFLIDGGATAKYWWGDRP